MINNYRIGNDIAISWRLLKAGQPAMLSAENLVLQIMDPKGNKSELPFEVAMDTISATFLGMSQKYTGRYTLILTENGGKPGMATVDHVQAFVLTPNTADVDASELSTDTLLLEGGFATIPQLIQALDELSLKEIEISASEDGRQAAEGLRQSQESARQIAESDRQSAELLREQAETDRNDSEDARVMAEQNRQSNYEILKAQLTDDINAAETIISETGEAKAEAIAATGNATSAATAANEAAAAASSAADLANTAASSATAAASSATAAAQSANTAATAANEAAAGIEGELGTLSTRVAESIKAVVSLPKDDSQLPTLCGQPSILFGEGTPQEAIVPINWKGLKDGGYAWTGLPSAIGQQYININVTTNGRYIAVRNGVHELKWLNF